MVLDYTLILQTAISQIILWSLQRQYLQNILQQQIEYLLILFYRNAEAAQAAAQAAARINQQLGVSSPPGNMQQPNSQMGGLGMVITEEFKVPDRMVGLSKYSLKLHVYPYRCVLLRGCCVSLRGCWVQVETNSVSSRLSDKFSVVKHIYIYILLPVGRKVASCGSDTLSDQQCLYFTVLLTYWYIVVTKLMSDWRYCKCCLCR